MRKPAFCLCKKKDADQLCGDREADHHLCYTPGIYAEGYIVFVFPFVRSYVRMFVRSFVRSFVRTSFRHVEFASKFCVKVSQVVYISATTHQKAFIFGP